MVTTTKGSLHDSPKESEASNNGKENVDAFSLRYQVLGGIGEGSYSNVLKCRNRETGKIYACKRLKHCYRNWAQVNEISEITTLRRLPNHPNILQMIEIHFEPDSGHVSLVFELMDMNLYELIKDRRRLLPESRVRVMIFQLIRGLRHLHKHGIFHRDVKPENILLKRCVGQQEDILKIGDLGSVRGLLNQPPYTEYISTRWYRSPECLLTSGHYGIKMDIWAVGCVFYEILTLRPLFPGSNELDQVHKIHKLLGPPPQKCLETFAKHSGEKRKFTKRNKQKRAEVIQQTIYELENGIGKSGNFDWYFNGSKEVNPFDRLLPTHVTTHARDLLTQLLQYDPEERPTAHRALIHPYFASLREAARKAMNKLSSAKSQASLVTIANKQEAPKDNLNKLTLDKQESPQINDNEKHKPSPIVVAKEVKASSKTSNRIDESIPRPPVQEESIKGFPVSNKPTKQAASTLLRKSEHFRKKLDIDPEFEVPQKTQNKISNSKIPISTIKSRDLGSTNKNPVVRTQAAGLLLKKKTLESKPSMVSLSKTSSKAKNNLFARELVDKATLSPAALRRINENRRLVHLHPIGIPEKVESTKIPQSTSLSPRKSTQLPKIVTNESYTSQGSGSQLKSTGGGVAQKSVESKHGSATGVVKPLHSLWKTMQNHGGTEHGRLKLSQQLVSTPSPYGLTQIRQTSQRRSMQSLENILEAQKKIVGRGYLESLKQSQNPPQPAALTSSIRSRTTKQISSSKLILGTTGETLNLYYQKSGIQNLEGMKKPHGLAQNKYHIHEGPRINTDNPTPELIIKKQQQPLFLENQSTGLETLLRNKKIALIKAKERTDITRPLEHRTTQVQKDKVESNPKFGPETRNQSPTHGQTLSLGALNQRRSMIHKYASLNSKLKSFGSNHDAVYGSSDDEAITNIRRRYDKLITQRASVRQSEISDSTPNSRYPHPHPPHHRKSHHRQSKQYNNVNDDSNNNINNNFVDLS